MRCGLVPASLHHTGTLAHRLRYHDRLECEALGRSPKDALRNGLRSSLEAFTVIAGGRPIAMLGVVSTGLLGGVGRVWMLGSEEVYRCGREMMITAPPMFDRWLETFDELSNIVARDNRRAIRVLVRWGFDVGYETQTIGGVAFVPFSMKRPVGVAAIQAVPAFA